MCLSSAPARFSGTRIAMISVGGGQQFLLYENIAQNLAPNGDPNAMILLIPSKRKLAAKNVIDTTSGKHVLRDMWEAVRPRSRGVARGAKVYGSARPSFQVVEMGIYHLVLASDAKGIAAGIRKGVPQDKRASVSNEILKGLEKSCPGYQFAVACFNNRDAKQATPLGIVFEAADPHTFVFPALDGHDGKAPRLDSPVEVDHWLFAGSLEHAYCGVPVSYTDDPNMDEALSSLLPGKITGARFNGFQPNGDFCISVQAALDGDWRQIRRGILNLG